MWPLPFAPLASQALGGALTRERFAIGLNRFRLGQELALVNRESGSVDFLGEESSHFKPSNPL
jgi:hypothetical protein